MLNQIEINLGFDEAVFIAERKEKDLRDINAKIQKLYGELDIIIDVAIVDAQKKINEINKLIEEAERGWKLWEKE